MPSQTTQIGPLTLPVPAGSAGERIADPAIDGLLAYFAFWIKNALDAKLANLTGTSSDAVPAANRFPFDPLHPRGFKVKLPVPALFLWWEGPSRIVPYTTVYKLRRRELGILYAFQELPSQEAMQDRDAIFNAVDGALVKASDRGWHPLFGYDGDPMSTPIRESLGGLDLFMFEYGGAVQGRFGGETAKRRKPDEGRDYPALRGTVVVHERVEQDVLEDPTDVDHDTAVTITTSDDTGSVTILEGLVPMADGTDPDQQ